MYKLRFYGLLVSLVFCLMAMVPDAGAEEVVLEVVGRHPGGSTNIPLTEVFYLGFNQEVSLDKDALSSVCIQRFDSSGTPEDDAVHLPSELSPDKRSVILYLSEVNNGTNTIYMKSGKRYKVTVNKDYVKTATGGKLAYNYCFFFETISENGVESVQNNQDGSTSAILLDPVIKQFSLGERLAYLWMNRWLPGSKPAPVLLPYLGVVPVGDNDEEVSWPDDSDPEGWTEFWKDLKSLSPETQYEELEKLMEAIRIGKSDALFLLHVPPGASLEFQKEIFKVWEEYINKKGVAAWMIEGVQEYLKPIEQYVGQGSDYRNFEKIPDIESNLTNYWKYMLDNDEQYVELYLGQNDSFNREKWLDNVGWLYSPGEIYDKMVRFESRVRWAKKYKDILEEVGPVGAEEFVKWIVAKGIKDETSRLLDLMLRIPNFSAIAGGAQVPTPQEVIAASKIPYTGYKVLDQIAEGFEETWLSYGEWMMNGKFNREEFVSKLRQEGFSEGEITAKANEFNVELNRAYLYQLAKFFGREETVKYLKDVADADGLFGPNELGGNAGPPWSSLLPQELLNEGMQMLSSLVCSVLPGILSDKVLAFLALCTSIRGDSWIPPVPYEVCRWDNNQWVSFPTASLSIYISIDGREIKISPHLPLGTYKVILKFSQGDFSSPDSPFNKDVEMKFTVTEETERTILVPPQNYDPYENENPYWVTMDEPAGDTHPGSQWLKIKAETRCADISDLQLFINNELVQTVSAKDYEWSVNPLEHQKDGYCDIAVIARVQGLTGPYEICRAVKSVKIDQPPVVKIEEVFFESDGVRVNAVVTDKESLKKVQLIVEKVSPQGKDICVSWNRSTYPRICNPLRICTLVNVGGLTSCKDNGYRVTIIAVDDAGNTVIKVYANEISPEAKQLPDDPNEGILPGGTTAYLHDDGSVSMTNLNGTVTIGGTRPGDPSGSVADVYPDPHQPTLTYTDPSMGGISLYHTPTAGVSTFGSGIGIYGPSYGGLGPGFTAPQPSEEAHQQWKAEQDKRVWEAQLLNSLSGSAISLENSVWSYGSELLFPQEAEAATQIESFFQNSNWTYNGYTGQDLINGNVPWSTPSSNSGGCSPQCFLSGPLFPLLYPLISGVPVCSLETALSTPTTSGINTERWVWSGVIHGTGDSGTQGTGGTSTGTGSTSSGNNYSGWNNYSSGGNNYWDLPECSGVPKYSDVSTWYGQLTVYDKYGKIDKIINMGNSPVNNNTSQPDTNFAPETSPFWIPGDFGWGFDDTDGGYGYDFGNFSDFDDVEIEIDTGDWGWQTDDYTSDWDDYTSQDYLRDGQCAFTVTVNGPIDKDVYPGESIQKAINAFTNCTITVHPGTYTENIDFKGKAITLTGENPIDSSTVANTVINGNNAGSVVKFSGTGSVLKGFTITKGSTEEYGGGIYVGENIIATVENCVVTGNSAAVGGGIHVAFGSTINIKNSKISSNTSSCGGGIYSYSSVIVSNSSIINNTSFDNCGGGIYSYGGSVTVTNSTISGNKAESYSYGGGLFCCGNLTAVNCLITNNLAYRGGGVYIGDNSTLTNCTFTQNNATNQGEGIYIGGGTTTITNCILWDDTAQSEIQNFRATIYATYSDIMMSAGTIYTGTGNINADPLFVNAANGNYHLQSASPCIDKGTNTGASSNDMEGNSRPHPGSVISDMGADESPYAVPVLASIGNKNVNEGATLSFTISATDSDSDTLAYSATNLPYGATFNLATKTFSWTPDYSQSSTYPNVHFEVSDGGLTDSEDITITVVNVNRPPVFTPKFDKMNKINGRAGKKIKFNVDATDPDNDLLEYVATDMPKGASFKSSTGLFTWTPTRLQTGNHRVVFTVTDGNAVLPSKTVRITVEPELRNRLTNP